MRKTYPKAFKFKVALEALKGNKTIADICQEYGVASSLVHKWKKQLQIQGMTVFGNKSNHKDVATDVEKSKLYEEIGRLKIELDFLKKSVGN